MSTLPPTHDAAVRAADIAQRCERATLHDDSWTARCPAHEDRTPSLGITSDGDGKVLIHCLAGCAPEAVMGALGLPMADLFVTPRQTRRNGHRRRRIVDVYPYPDASGQLLHETVRFAPKGFSQRRPDPAKPGAYLWNLDGIEPVLFNLPAVLAAIAAGELVHLAEGEKDAKTLIQLGLVGTTVPMGAKYWRPSYTATLTGAHVIVWPDNDKPGEDGLMKVQRELTGQAQTLRVARVPASHKDVSDWREAGATIAEVEALVEAATAPASLAETPESPATSQALPAWRKALFATKAGELHETENNLQAIFAHHPYWQGRLWWDVVAFRAYLDGRQPLDIHYVRNEVSPWLGATMRMPIRHGTRVLEVMRSWAQRQPRDPIVEWLQTLPDQDETDPERELLGTYLHTHAGAEDTPYNRFVSRLLIVSLVQRARHPGIQYRYVIVLEGEENVGKTQLLRRLGDRWHQEFPKSVEGKEAYMQLQGYWLVELGELDALKPAQETRIKMFISQQMDVWIPKFENDVLERPRRCILVGTTNEREYLKGEHGNTRYLPIYLPGPIEHGKIAEVRDRLFTQAKHYLADHPDDWWAIPEDVEAEVLREREARREPSVFEDPLRAFLLGRTRCTVAEALDEALHIPQAQWSKRLEMEVTKAFKGLKWYRHIEWDTATQKTSRFWASTPQKKTEVPF